MKNLSEKCLRETFFLCFFDYRAHCFARRFCTRVFYKFLQNIALPPLHLLTPHRADTMSGTRLISQFESNRLTCVKEHERHTCTGESDRVTCTGESDQLTCTDKSDRVTCIDGKDRITCINETDLFTCIDENDHLKYIHERDSRTCINERGRLTRKNKRLPVVPPLERWQRELVRREVCYATTTRVDPNRACERRARLAPP